MVKADQILRRIDEATDNTFVEFPRLYLGMSGIGEECVLKIWLRWRWAKLEKFSPRMKRLFQRGHREEKHVVDRLRGALFPVSDLDPKTGEQYEFVLHDGHIKGHCDGDIKLTKRWGTLEIKTHKHSSFTALRRAKSVKVAKIEHWYQCQRYMGAKGHKYALYVAVNKDNDAIYTEIIMRDNNAINFLMRREVDLVTRITAPAKICENGEYYKCKFCTFYDICFFREKVHRTCRMCKNAELRPKGKWGCTLKSRELSVHDQLSGCKAFDIVS